MLDGGEVALEFGHERRIRAALKHFCQERAAGVEHVGGKCSRAFDQADNAKLIRFAMPRGVAGHVGHHDHQRGNRAARS